MYKYVRSLKYDEKPDYDLIKYFIIKDIESSGKQIDGQFEWTDLSNSTNSLVNGS